MPNCSGNSSLHPWQATIAFSVSPAEEQASTSSEYNFETKAPTSVRRQIELRTAAAQKSLALLGGVVPLTTPRSIITAAPGDEYRLPKGGERGCTDYYSGPSGGMVR